MRLVARLVAVTTIALAAAVPGYAQQATVDAFGSRRSVAMQGLASQVAILKAKVVSATMRLMKIKECHAKGTFFRTLDDGVTEGCRSIVPCIAPDGSTIPPDGSITTYQSSVVPYGSSCVAQDRICNNGNLSGSYTAMSCFTGTPAACALPWGGSIAHGQSVTAYQSNLVSPGGSCAPYAQTRTCNNGMLSGSYQYSACSVQPTACSLPWGGSLNNSQSVTAYAAQLVEWDSSCAAESRTCSGGALSGSYVYGSCSQKVDPYSYGCQWWGFWLCPQPVPGYSCHVYGQAGYWCDP